MSVNDETLPVGFIDTRLQRIGLVLSGPDGDDRVTVGTFPLDATNLDEVLALEEFAGSGHLIPSLERLPVGYNQLRIPLSCFQSCRETGRYVSLDDLAWALVGVDERTAAHAVPGGDDAGVSGRR